MRNDPDAFPSASVGHAYAYAEDARLMEDAHDLVWRLRDRLETQGKALAEAAKVITALRARLEREGHLQTKREEAA